MRERALAGYMGDYIHRGFIPSPCTDLMRQNIFETVINGEAWLESPAGKLEFTAALNYGRDASHSVVEAWNLFSRAMSECFPYSPGVCRYPGPLQASPGQPFYLDKNKKVKRRAARYNTNDLQWTKAYFDGKEIPGWDSELLSGCFRRFVEIYEEGIGVLKSCNSKQALSGNTGPRERENLEGLLRIAEMQVCMVKSMIHFIDFIKLRDRLGDGGGPGACAGGGNNGSLQNIYGQIKTVCQKELANAADALKLCMADSNLGFSCEGQGTVRGGYFTPFTIGEKIEELKETMDEIDLILEGRQFV